MCVYHPPLEGTYSNIIDAFQSDEMENIRQEMRDAKDLNVSVISMMNQINILADSDINERYPEPPSTKLFN